MAEKFSRWDSADYLKTDKDMALYFEICTADDPGDGSLIRSALGAPGLTLQSWLRVRATFSLWRPDYAASRNLLRISISSYGTLSAPASISTNPSCTSRCTSS